MKIIRLSGTVGADFSAASLAVELHDAAGDDLDIQIASPGGSVFDGLEIFNAIRDYRRANPSAQIVITLKGLAASMASYIASVDVANKVRAEDNAVFMVHNPWSISAGDWKEAQKTADFLKGLADLLATAYVKRSRKSRAEITKMMDAETWLFGDEIKAAGFADEILATSDGGKKEGKAAAISRARLAFAEARGKLRGKPEDIDKAAALVRSTLVASSPSSTGCRSEAESSARLAFLEAKIKEREALAKLDANGTAEKAPWVPGQIVENHVDLSSPTGRVQAGLDALAREAEEEARQAEARKNARPPSPYAEIPENYDPDYHGPLIECSDGRRRLQYANYYELSHRN